MIKISIDIPDLGNLVSRFQIAERNLGAYTSLARSWPAIKSKLPGFLDESFQELQSRFRGVSVKGEYIARKTKMLGMPIEVGRGVTRIAVSLDPLELTKYLHDSIKNVQSGVASYSSTVGNEASANFEIGLNLGAFKNEYPAMLEQYLESHGMHGFMYLSEEQKDEISVIVADHITQRINEILGN